MIVFPSAQGPLPASRELGRRWELSATSLRPRAPRPLQLGRRHSLSKAGKWIPRVFARLSLAATADFVTQCASVWNPSLGCGEAPACGEMGSYHPSSVPHSVPIS